MGMAGIKSKTTGRRKDPKARHVDGSAPWATVKDRQDDRHYVLVYMGDGAEHGVEYYESLGYVPEEHRKGGPALRAGKTGKEGERITMRGHLLMSCDAETRQNIEQYGPDGTSGQQVADEIERAMLKPGGIDQLRGIGIPRGVDVQGGTSRPEIEA